MYIFVVFTWFLEKNHSNVKENFAISPFGGSFSRIEVANLLLV